VVGADHEETDQFPLGPGGPLKGKGAETGDGLEVFLEFVEEADTALGMSRGKQGMGTPEAPEIRGFFIHLGVVFHGAGAQGIELPVNGIVFPGQKGEMADRRTFVQFREGQFVP
jgi:hypothetical protein